MYRTARIETSETLQRGVAEGILHPRDCLREDCFASACVGILASPQTPRKFKRFYERSLKERL